jgi:hypothetical protein
MMRARAILLASRQFVLMLNVSAMISGEPSVIRQKLTVSPVTGSAICTHRLGLKDRLAATDSHSESERWMFLGDETLL